MSNERTASPAPPSVPQAIGRLRVAMDRAYLRASREVGLTAQQAELLCAALRPDAVTDLARVLRRDHSTISRLADRAAARGLLYRRGEDSDGRMSVIELTTEGRQLAERFIKALESRTQPLLSTWSERRQRAAAQTLTQLAQTLEAADAVPSMVFTPTDASAGSADNSNALTMQSNPDGIPAH